MDREDIIHWITVAICAAIIVTFFVGCFEPHVIKAKMQYKECSCECTSEIQSETQIPIP